MSRDQQQQLQKIMERASAMKQRISESSESTKQQIALASQPPVYQNLTAPVSAQFQQYSNIPQQSQHLPQQSQGQFPPRNIVQQVDTAKPTLLVKPAEAQTFLVFLHLKALRLIPQAKVLFPQSVQRVQLILNNPPAQNPLNSQSQGLVFDPFMFNQISLELRTYDVDEVSAVCAAQIVIGKDEVRNLLINESGKNKYSRKTVSLIKILNVPITCNFQVTRQFLIGNAQFQLLCGGRALQLFVQNLQPNPLLEVVLVALTDEENPIKTQEIGLQYEGKTSKSPESQLKKVAGVTVSLKLGGIVVQNLDQNCLGLYSIICFQPDNQLANLCNVELKPPFIEEKFGKIYTSVQTPVINNGSLSRSEVRFDVAVTLPLTKQNIDYFSSGRCLIAIFGTFQDPRDGSVRKQLVGATQLSLKEEFSSFKQKGEWRQLNNKSGYVYVQVGCYKADQSLGEQVSKVGVEPTSALPYEYQFKIQQEQLTRERSVFEKQDAEITNYYKMNTTGTSYVAERVQKVNSMDPFVSRVPQLRPIAGYENTIADIMKVNEMVNDILEK